MINYRCVVTNSAAHTVFYVASLPTNLRPSKVLHCAAWVADSPGNRHGASLQIQPTGELHLIAGVGNFVEAGFLATFILILQIPVERYAHSEITGTAIPL